MGKKAKGDYTPEERAVFKKMAGGYTPEQRAKLKEMLAGGAAGSDEAAELDRARKMIDHHAAIRDGLMPPPWAVTKNQKSKSESKHESEEPKRELGWQQARVKQVVPLLPDPLPDGRVLSNFTDKEFLKALEPEFKKRGWKLPSLDSVARFRRPARRLRRHR